MSSQDHSFTTDPPSLDGIDPSFVFDFAAYDELEAPGQRWSTWLSVEPLCRGPEPRPDWLVTSQGAVDTDLGILKTGKEADVFLLERADPHEPERAVVMAAKRYRGEEHRTFHRSGKGKLLRTNPVEAEAVVAEIRRRLDGVELFVTQPGLRAEIRARLDNVADLERLGHARALLADRRDDRLMLPGDDLRGQAQGGDVLFHMFNLRPGRVRFHDHDHDRRPPLNRIDGPPSIGFPTHADGDDRGRRPTFLVRLKFRRSRRTNKKSPGA